MKKYLLFLIILGTLSSCSSTPPKEETRKPQSNFDQLAYLEYSKIGTLEVNQRMGYLLESTEVPFKGCVLYLEGLGDSIRNHQPYFTKLNNAGYRILMFDYMGQGGSQGTMNDSRVDANIAPGADNYFQDIGAQAKFVWQKYSTQKDPVHQRTCAQSPKMVIGWSTGGLAAYRLAHEAWADAVVLLAPGIVPHIFVGKSQNDWFEILSNNIITEPTLTRNRFAQTENPHVDSINPNSMRVVMKFATNLILTSLPARSDWTVPSRIRGLVFLSGENDSYVDRKDTLESLQKNAPHFQKIEYDGALHELDNEIPSVANDVHDRTILFLNSMTKL